MRKTIGNKKKGAAAIALALLGMGTTVPASATPAPVGGTIAVSSSALGILGSAAVATNADGSFTVAWTAEDATGADNVYARQFAANGTPKGPEIQVNTNTGGTFYWYAPNIAADANGNFVVVWTSAGTTAYSAVYAHRFSSNGASLGNDFRVDSDAESLAINEEEAYTGTSVAMDDAGDFVVAWPAQFASSGKLAVVAERFGADGTPQDAQPIQVTEQEKVKENASGTSNDFPAVAMDRSTGSFVISWVNSHFIITSLDPALNFAWGGVMAQRYASTGKPQGLKISVAYTHFSNIPSSLMMVQQPPLLSMDASGNFLLSWDGAASQTASSDSVFARHYSSTGKASGAAYPVAPSGVYGANMGGQEIPAGIGMDPAGNFVAAWETSDSSSEAAYLQAQSVSAAGSLQGAAFSVPTSTAVAKSPVVALSASGPFTVIWSGWSFDSQGGFTSQGIYAQQFSAP